MLNFCEVVTSRQNPTVKRICALSEKKKRYEEGLFRFDGIKLFREAAECGLCIEYAVIREGVSSDIELCVADAVKRGIIRKNAVLLVSESVFEKISEEKSPEGIITVARFPKNVVRHDEGIEVESGEKILLAQSLRDAGNLGTVIRSCAALGIDRLIISADCADVYNPKTIRGAMGGIFRLNIDVMTNDAFATTIGNLRKSGRTVYAAALREDALKIGQGGIAKNACFVIGNEGHGLSQDVIDACDACAIIPMTEGSESLNAAAAAAICIWETVRSAEK